MGGIWRKPVPPPPPPSMLSHFKIQIGEPYFQVALTIFIAVLTVVLFSPPLRLRFGGIYGRVRLFLLLSTPSISTSSPSRRVVSLHSYPLKSCQALNHDSVTLSSYGLKNDRVLMIVRSGSKAYEPKRFFTQRQCGGLATIKIEPYPTKIASTSTRYKLTSSILPRSSPPLIIEYPPPATNTKTEPVILWDDTLQVIDMGDSASSYITNIVNHFEAPTRSSLPPRISPYGTLRLVAFDPKSNCRYPNPFYFPSTALTLSGIPPQSALSDGFPILITTTASLRDLNDHITARHSRKTSSPTNISMDQLFKNKPNSPPPTVTMDRFRANIVIENSVPWEEDSWRIIRINKQIFHIVKGCPRCKQSCTDQKTGEVTEEPVETLKTFRCMSTLHPDDVYFGQNVSTNSVGPVSVGDEVEVLVSDPKGRGVWDKGPVSAE